jgi:hypothetical protein
MNGTLTYQKVLFDAKSTSPISPIFYVWPGYVALISLFGLATAYVMDECKITNVAAIKVQKVMVGEAVLPQFDGSCGKELAAIISGIPRDQVTREEDVMQCCTPWVITPCDNYKLLTVPGAYQLELIATDQLGEIYVEQVTFPVEQAMAIPSGLILGN